MRISWFISCQYPKQGSRESGSHWIPRSFFQCPTLNKSSLYDFCSLKWSFEVYFLSRGVLSLWTPQGCQRPKEFEGTRSSRTGFRGGCEPSWLLGTKPGSSAGTASVLTSDPSPSSYFPFEFDSLIYELWLNLASWAQALTSRSGII